MLHLQCYQMGKKSPKIAPSHAGIRTPMQYMVTWAGPTAPHTPNAISIEPAIYSGSCSIIPILYYGMAPSPPQNCPAPEGLGLPSNTWWLWPTPPRMPNGILIGPAVFAGYLVFTWQTDRHTDRHTDHATTSVAIGRIYAMHIMRPKNMSKLLQG